MNMYRRSLALALTAFLLVALVRLPTVSADDAQDKALESLDCRIQDGEIMVTNVGEVSAQVTSIMYRVEGNEYWDDILDVSLISQQEHPFSIPDEYREFGSTPYKAIGVLSARGVLYPVKLPAHLLVKSNPSDIGAWATVDDLVLDLDNTWTLDPGTYIVTYGDVEGYDTPNDNEVTLDFDESKEITGRYIPLSRPLLAVRTIPFSGGVFVDGLSWGMAPQTRSVDPGTHTITYDNVENYVTPSNDAVTLGFGEYEEVVGEYRCKLTTSISGSGSVSLYPDELQDIYEYGTEVTLTANAGFMHKFDYWSGDLVGFENPGTISMNSNKHVTANFKLVTETIIPDPPQNNEPPIADAGGPYSVDEGETVELKGTGSSDPDGDTLTYAWTITDDPTGESTLTNPSTATPTFHAPSVDSNTDVTVKLIMDDGHGHTDSDTATVTVVNVVEPEPEFARIGVDPTSRTVYRVAYPVSYFSVTVELTGGGGAVTIHPGEWGDTSLNMTNGGIFVRRINGQWIECGEDKSFELSPGESAELRYAVKDTTLVGDYPLIFSATGATSATFNLNWRYSGNDDPPTDPVLTGYTWEERTNTTVQLSASAGGWVDVGGDFELWPWMSLPSLSSGYRWVHVGSGWFSEFYKKQYKATKYYGGQGYSVASNYDYRVDWTTESPHSITYEDWSNAYAKKNATGGTMTSVWDDTDEWVSAHWEGGNDYRVDWNVWVPGYYTGGNDYRVNWTVWNSHHTWVPGHNESYRSWEKVGSHRESYQKWISGHYETRQRWVSGHYEYYEYWDWWSWSWKWGKTWVSGHYESYQKWISGHYETRYRTVNDYGWVTHTRWVSGRWVGDWEPRSKTYDYYWQASAKQRDVGGSITAVPNPHDVWHAGYNKSHSQTFNEYSDASAKKSATGGTLTYVWDDTDEWVSAHWEGGNDYRVDWTTETPHSMTYGDWSDAYAKKNATGGTMTSVLVGYTAVKVAWVEKSGSTAPVPSSNIRNIEPVYA